MCADQASVDLTTLDYSPSDIARKGRPTSHSTVSVLVADILHSGISSAADPMLTPALVAQRLSRLAGKRNSNDMMRSLVAMRLSLNASTFDVGRLFPAGLHWQVLTEFIDQPTST